MGIEINRRTKVLAAAGILALAAAGSTFAAYTDTGAVTSSFATGTLDLEFDDAQQGSPTAYEIVFDGGDSLQPGASVAKDLEVYNSGSIAADLALLNVTDEAGKALTSDFAKELKLTIKDGSDVLVDGADITTAAAAFKDLGIGTTTDAKTKLSFTVTMDQDATTAVAGQGVDVYFNFEPTQTSLRS